MFEELWAKRCEIQERTGVVSPYVFIYWSGKKAGQPFKSFKGPWKSALFHDLRRTAVRRSVRTPGIHPKVAMQLSGHKTDSVFRRYDILTADMQEARDALNRAAKVEASKVMDKDTVKAPVADRLNGSN